MHNSQPSRLRTIATSLTASAILLAGATQASAAPIPLDTTDSTPERVILNPTADPATSQIVTWRVVGTTMDVPATAEIRDSSGAVTTVEATAKSERDVAGQNAVTFTARFENLSPDTEYVYRVATGSTSSDWYNFTTANNADDPYTFTWYGDGQNDLTEKWTPIVNLAKEAFPNSELTLQTGDLINLSVEDEWEEWFTITDGERQTENWLPAVGNHEYSRDTVASYWNDSFTFDSNGPEASSGTVNSPYEELIANHFEDKVYYTDYQGVRYITLSSHFRTQAHLEAAEGVDLPDISTADWRGMYMGMQAEWLDDVLEDSDANWNVVQFHHPAMSVSQGRDNREVREAFLPVITDHEVDLVLSGHDHTYARGYLNDDKTDTEGVTDGPVFVVSNSGPKYYNLANDASNVWLQNDATQVVKHEHTSFIHGLRVTPNTLEYEAVAAQKGDRASFDGEVGETADSFTITKNNNGTTSVTEGIDRRVATGLGDTTVEPVDGDIQINAQVPDAGVNGPVDPTAPSAGALTLTLASDAQINMGDATNAGDRWTFASALPRLGVTDTRAEATGWSLSGSATNLAGASDEISSANMGWAPRVLGASTANPGGAILSTLRGGAGLTDTNRLATADDHSRFGTTEVIADLHLDVPAAAEAGDYAGAINVSLFPVD